MVRKPTKAPAKPRIDLDEDADRQRRTRAPVRPEARADATVDAPQGTQAPEREPVPTDPRVVAPAPVQTRSGVGAQAGDSAPAQAPAGGDTSEPVHAPMGAPTRGGAWPPASTPMPVLAPVDSHSADQVAAQARRYWRTPLRTSAGKVAADRARARESEQAWAQVCAQAYAAGCPPTAVRAAAWDAGLADGDVPAPPHTSPHPHTDGHATE